MSRVFSEELVNSVAKEMKVADLANVKEQEMGF